MCTSKGRIWGVAFGRFRAKMVEATDSVYGTGGRGVLLGKVLNTTNRSNRVMSLVGGRLFRKRPFSHRRCVGRYNSILCCLTLVTRSLKAALRGVTIAGGGGL